MRSSRCRWMEERRRCETPWATIGERFHEWMSRDGGNEVRDEIFKTPLAIVDEGIADLIGEAP